MKRLLSILTSLILVLAVSSTSLAASLVKENNVLKSYFVAFHNTIDANLIKSYGGQIKRHYRFMPVVSVKLPEKAAEALKNNPKIDYIEIEGTAKALGQEIPWGIPHVKATDVQQSGITGSGIKVGIIDTGIDYSHDDLVVRGGATFVVGTKDYMDDNGHGTHVAGTVAALNNEFGVLGVAPKADLFAIKVLDHYGDGSYSDLIAGIEWAVTNQMDIINMSLGGNSDSRTLKKALVNAYNSGILLIASAGNNGYDKIGTITYPAKYDSVIAVGAVNERNERAVSSSVGRELDIMAPGVVIQSTVPGGYAYNSGTSMASPHVAGVAALLMETDPSLINIQLMDVLMQTATSLGDSFSYGNGLVDALGAINYIRNTTVSVSRK